MGRWTWARLAIVASGVPLAALAACQLFVNSDVFQCATDQDCANQFPEQHALTCENRVCVAATDGGDSGNPPDTGSDVSAQDADTDGPFSCANNVYPEEDPTKHVTYTRVFQDVFGGTPLTQIGVRVCSINDVQCQFPRAQDGGTLVVPDSTGRVTVDVDYGFNGLLQVTDLVPGARIVTNALIQVTPPVIVEAGVGPVALMVSPDEFSSTANNVFPDGGSSTLPDGGQDPTLAHIFFRTNDCQNQPLKNISVDTDRTDPRAQPFYFVSGILADPTAAHTDEGGKGGILNLQPGTVTLTARLYPTTQKMGSVVVKLRGGYITYVIITPSN